ncbi:AAEL006348-PA [Aedes aegypti]|uniref:AAEL006348-PA n=1 Tax=Aedes aegypti TaxID=7159 RepID=Q176L0_AEDAE|nr:AAEL006348-PA [Aedes aegypti]
MWNKFVGLLLLISQIKTNFSRTAVESQVDDKWENIYGEQFMKDDGCKISLGKELNIKQPLFLVPGTETFYTPLPNTTDLMFHSGEQLELFCTRGFANSDAVPSKTTSIVTSCDGDDGFIHNGETYNISQLTCRAPVFHVAVRTGGRCFNEASLVKIGFDMGSRFAKIYEACFDENSMQTYYVKHSLSPANAKHQSTKRPPSFIQGDFYPSLRMTKLYNIESQRKTFEKILGSSARADALLNSKQDMFLARGHLAAKADFVFGAHQRATFWFINVAPQWQKFNAFNWQRIETGVKDFVARNDLNVTVYTGTYGILELADANGDMQPIYLDIDPDNGGRIPVPKVYYKVLHDEQNDAGIVLIGVNNPHATMDEIKDNYMFCEDVADKISWLKWKRDFIPGGYSYACDVNEFNAVTNHLPLNNISKLLT